VILTEFLLARVCSVEGCDRNGKLTRGMCAKHYRHWLDHTPPDQRETAPRFRRSFWDFIDKSGECWIWTGPTNRQGYGWWSPGRTLAHRHSWTLARGEIIEGLWVLHHCDNPPCIRPAHLYLGTVVENARDFAERGEPSNQNTAKTHCKNGHPLAGENLRTIKGYNKRVCRECDNAKSRERQRRYRESRNDVD